MRGLQKRLGLHLLFMQLRLQKVMDSRWLDGSRFVKGVPTGCPRVRGYFQTPSFSAIGGWILKPFGMVNAHTGRFDLVYDNP